ncbi:hypothetical protein JQN47_28100 [Escherichia coli]|nr:hypothetical protein [Escherichia coli]
MAGNIFCNQIDLLLARHFLPFEKLKKAITVCHPPPLLLDHTGIGSRLNNWRINGF